MSPQHHLTFKIIAGEMFLFLSLREAVQDQTKTSCLTFSPAAGADWWEASHTLQHPPVLSWPSPEGLMMLGANKTTEILTNNGDTIESFQLDYKIR